MYSVDCQANTIAERMSNFSKCCKKQGTYSDCRCPRGCAEAEGTEDGIVEDGSECKLVGSVGFANRYKTRVMSEMAGLYRRWQ